MFLILLGSDKGEGSEKEGGERAESQRSAILSKYSPKLVKQILELLCDESVCIFFLFSFCSLIVAFFPVVLSFFLALVILPPILFSS